MDEIVLFVFGILFEEVGWEVLGWCGDLVFIEEVDILEVFDDDYMIEKLLYNNDSCVWLLSILRMK